MDRPNFRSASRQRRNRSGRFAWFVVAGGTLSALALVAYGLLHGGAGQNPDQDWLTVREQLHARGEPLSTAEITPAAVPDAENFFADELFAGLAGDQPTAPLLQRAINPGRGLSVSALLSSTSQSGGASLDAIGVTMLNAGLVRKQTEFLLAGDRVRAGLRTLGLDFAPLIAAADRPRARFPIDYTRIYPPLPHLRYVQALGDWLAIHAMAALSSGDHEGAAVDLLLIIRLADSVRDEPFLASLQTRRHLLALASGCVRVGIAWDAWSDEQLTRFTEAFSQPRLLADLARALRGERAQLNAAVDASLTKKDPAATPPPELTRWLGPDLAQLDPRALRARQIAANTALQADIDRLTGTPAPENTPPTPAPPGLPPLLASEIRLTLQIQTYLAQAAVACALERHRLLHGTYPEKLSDLVPALLESLPEPGTGSAWEYTRPAGDTFQLTAPGWDPADRWTWSRR